nr:PREDICTED: uncharacterized mitochondrial protein AtMg00810-like [Nicotiana tabacum]
MKDLGLSGANPVGTPLEMNQKLTSVYYDTWLHNHNVIADEKLKDPSIYQGLVGRLLYLTMTRPDLAFAVQVLSQFMHCPKDPHLEYALRVVKYTMAEPGLGVLMPAESISKLTAYCDLDWGACVETKRSVTGYLVKFGGSLISWKSNKQENVFRSSVEAEFRSMASCTAEITWLVGMFKELGIHVDLPVQLMCDNKPSIEITANPISHERTKHIDINYHFVRERIIHGLIKTEHVSTKEKLAHLLIKGLGKAQHDYLLRNLGVKNLFQPSA